MAQRKLSTVEFNLLAMLIGRFGLAEIMRGLAAVANTEAKFLRTNRQDNKSAFAWDHAASRLDTISRQRGFDLRVAERVAIRHHEDCLRSEL